MRRGALVALLLVSVAASAAAQQDSLLARATRLATEGQADSARVLVRARLSRLSPSDSAYAEALFAAGVVAADADSALIYLRRVSIEYPRSRWADAALLRAAQLSFGMGDYGAARRSAERVLLDYPFSGLLNDARFWAARAHLELGSLVGACRLFDELQADTTIDVELANRARFYRQRCAAMAAAGDSAPQDTAGAGRGGEPVPAFAVQVAAVRNATAADELMRSLAAQGYEPHVVRDTDGLFKVRVGRLRTRAQAQELAAELRAKLGGRPFVVEQP